MTEKELRKLSRGDLVEILYRLMKQQEEMEEELKTLRAAAADRALRQSEAGSIAEAALAVTGVFEKAQEAADLYLQEVQAQRAEAWRLRREAEALLADARAKTAMPEADEAHPEGSCAAEKERGETA